MSCQNCVVMFQAINPLLILAFIPLFDYVVYPLLDKCRIPNRWLSIISSILTTFSLFSQICSKLSLSKTLFLCLNNVILQWILRLFLRVLVDRVVWWTDCCCIWWWWYCVNSFCWVRHFLDVNAGCDLMMAAGLECVCVIGACLCFVECEESCMVYRVESMKWHWMDRWLMCQFVGDMQSLLRY